MNRGHRKSGSMAGHILRVGLTALLGTLIVAGTTMSASRAAADTNDPRTARTECQVPYNGAATMYVMSPSPAPTTLYPYPGMVGSNTQKVGYQASLYQYINGVWQLRATSPYLTTTTDSWHGITGWTNTATGTASNGMWYPRVSVLAQTRQYFSVVTKIWWYADSTHYSDFWSGRDDHYEWAAGSLYYMYKGYCVY